MLGPMVNLILVSVHTLEDISNPLYVSQKLSEISNGGYIAVPTKYVELARFEDPEFNYRGYIHHRWIFSIKNNKFIGYPKIVYLERDPKFDAIASTDPNTRDLSFYWKDTVGLEIVNNDYLGPSGKDIYVYYNGLLLDDLDTQRT